ncbi:MAG: hypothetical protein QXU22_02020 [Desulfurococcaceae archaeon]
MKNKSILMILILMSLITIAHTTVPIEVFTEPDPPSVFNAWAGGLSQYYYLNVHRSEVTTDLSYVARRNPNEYALIIPGSGRVLIPSSELFEWVEKGGIVIVMDESTYIYPLLDRLGLRIERSFNSIDSATCNIDGEIITVVFNVYVVLRNVDNLKGNTTPICLIDGNPVAWKIPYGRGVFYVIGDSSIVINEVLSQHSISSENMLFLEILVQRRKIIFYDSFTRKEVTTMERLLDVLSWFINVVTHAAGVIKTQDMLIRIVAYTVLAVIPASILFIMIGELELPLRYKEELLKPSEVLDQVKRKLRKYVGA